MPPHHRIENKNIGPPLALKCTHSPPHLTQNSNAWHQRIAPNRTENSFANVISRRSLGRYAARYKWPHCRKNCQSRAKNLPAQQSLSSGLPPLAYACIQHTHTCVSPPQSVGYTNDQPSHYLPLTSSGSSLDCPAGTNAACESLRHQITLKKRINISTYLGISGPGAVL